MSFDFKLARRCDHRLFRQIRFFDADRRTVRLGTLLGSTFDFQVFLNGDLVPSNSPTVGWDLVKDETSVDPGQKKVLFREPRKALDDWVELSYFTSSQTCPKCGSFDLLFDYEYSNIGLPLRVINEQKLIQDIEKILLTIKGSSIYFPWYGTSLVAQIGTKVATHNRRAKIQREVSQALENLKSLQSQQETFQEVTDREFLYRIEGISVIETEDPTMYRLYGRVMTQAGGTVPFSAALKFDRGFLRLQTEQVSQRTAF